MAVTLATPPAGPNEQIDTVNVELYCDGIDPVLGVPRPPMSNPETFSINVSTSQGPEPKNTIGLLEKQGLPAGNCYLAFTAVSNTGNTECTGEITVAIVTDQTTPSEVVLACIHTPRYGGIRTDGTFNQCAEYRQILVTPTTQSIGNLVDIATEVYDPDGDPVTVDVTTTGACGNVVGNLGSAASCETVSGCETVVNTVECTGVGLCQIIVALSDDGFDSCTGLLPDGSNNNAARRTIDVDCTVASGCGNGILEPGEDCDPPDGVFCDANCQDIDNCAPDPCNQSDVCSPEVCTADPNDNSAICTPDPGSAAGDACSPPTGGTCDGQGNCVACTVDADCEDNNECTDNACVAGACEFTNNDANSCSVGGLPGSCNAGVCEGLCTGVTCPDAGECVTNVCDPADGSCNPQNDGINTGCDLGGSAGVCDGAGACVECNIDAQCASGETCVNNVCEGAGLVCEYDQDFEAMVPGDPPQPVPNSLSEDGWLVGANVFDTDGTTFLYDYFAFPAPNGGPAFSAVAVGEGGPEQGAQQLSIYNDYNNADHALGRVIEAIVFRERTIVASDAGTTLTFKFDAKAGNIEGASTALAFVKTLDPSAGFATTNNITQDTTNLPASWGTFTISLLVDASLVGQTLQYGFQTRASNFEGSGNFYDNVSLCTSGGGGGECVVDADCPDDGNDCTAAACNAGTCETSNVADGTACDGGAGTCNAGVCDQAPIACEYGQDFESAVPGDPPQPVPNSLSEDGWLVGANVFAPDGTTFLYDYFAFPAPNGGAGFSAVAVGEGGPEQGAQQLSIYNDYNNADHAVGNIIEAIVFRERTIVASDIGTTISFTFDAKAGNIEGASTALAFIKTLDPGAGFATIDNITQDTTNLPASWGTFTLSLVVDASKVGYILQYGYQTRASNFEGSGNFYDNISVGPTGCVVDNGGGGPSGDIAINGGFETGAFNDGSPDASWQQFPNGGIQTIVTDNPSEGTFAANLVVPVRVAGDGPVDNLIKNANLEAGNLTPGQAITVTWDMRGSLQGDGGVVFVELFSEFSGGGATGEIYTGAPIFPTAGWQSFTWNTNLGGDVSGGVTLQLKVSCGPVVGCGADVYFDNVTITLP
jgi:ribosomal protein L14